MDGFEPKTRLLARADARRRTSILPNENALLTADRETHERREFLSALMDESVFSDADEVERRPVLLSSWD